MCLIADIHGAADEYPIIIAGHFNLVLNPDMDSCNYKHAHNPDNRDQVLDMLIDYNLVNVWRYLDAEEKQYTWRRKMTDEKARLDIFIISESLLVETKLAKISPGYRTDHSMSMLQLDFGKFEKGTTYWKFNNSLLKDIKYVREIKQLIQNIKEQYAFKDQNESEDSWNDGNNIPSQNVKLKINDQLFLSIIDGN